MKLDGTRPGHCPQPARQLRPWEPKFATVKERCKEEVDKEANVTKLSYNLPWAEITSFGRMDSWTVSRCTV